MGRGKSFSVQGRFILQRFLPQPITSREGEEALLDSAFTTDENFCFGSPLTKVFNQVKGGCEVGSNIIPCDT
jgi:hypothetical protein